MSRLKNVANEKRQRLPKQPVRGSMVPYLKNTARIHVVSLYNQYLAATTCLLALLALFKGQARQNRLSVFTDFRKTLQSSKALIPVYKAMSVQHGHKLRLYYINTNKEFFDLCPFFINKEK